MSSAPEGPVTVHPGIDLHMGYCWVSFISCLLTFLTTPMPGMRVQDSWGPRSHLPESLCHLSPSAAPGPASIHHRVPLAGTHGHPFPSAWRNLLSFLEGAPFPSKLLHPAFTCDVFFKKLSLCPEASPFPLRLGVWRARPESNFISEAPSPEAMSTGQPSSLMRGQWWG